MRFNPEDESITGPRCRNCHKGSSSCGACHNAAPGGNLVSDAYITNPDALANNPGKDEGMLVSENVNLDAATPAAWRTDITNLFMILMLNPAPGYSLHDGDNAAYTGYKLHQTSTGSDNEIAAAKVITENISGTDYSSQGGVKDSRTVGWTSGWRASETTSSPTC